MQLTHPSIAAAAQAYLNAGLCVLPARRAEKRPAIGTWKRYQQRRPTEAELSAWFANNHDALCILCGQASGNGEMIDFDAGGALFDAWAKRIPPDLLAKLVIESTQRNGRHVFYRGEQSVCGNMKLAQRRSGTSGGGDQVETLIETRGEGGLFLCAPTPGYELIQGDLANPPVLTVAERDILLQAAWDLNEYVPPVVNGPKTSATVGQTGPLSGGQAPLSAENSQIGDCPTHSASSGWRMALSVEQSPGSADNSHNDHCSSHTAHSPQRMPLSGGQGQCAAEISDRPGDDYNRRGDPRQVLEQYGWVRVRGGDNEYWRRPGKESGTSATLKGGVFYVFSSNAAPFEPNRAYSPFAVYTLLNHGGDFEQAARSLAQLGYGADHADSLPTASNGADISAIVRMSATVGGCSPHHADRCEQSAENPDPGPTPAEMLRIPGLISEVMDHTLKISPYPNPVMAFAGALALQAFLAGRKVRDPGDNRTNLYLLGLAHSGAGKDHSRKVNGDILHAIGMSDCLGLYFATSEGVQDALFQTPSMLFQTDEIDAMLQVINKSKDARYESIMSMMLTMYSTANSVFPMRRKAGKESPGVIDQPCLVIYGTAIPNHYYQALNERMLTNGLFARMVIVESMQRPPGQEPLVISPPPRVLETAKWWADYQPGEGNLGKFHPIPAIVEHTADAKRLLIETRLQSEVEYAKAESQSDPVGTAVWARVSEQTRKLALIYAVSENHRNPSIGLAAVQWASQFVMHQTRRMLFMAAGHVADNPFHAECLKAVGKLRAAPRKELPHSALLRRMKMDSKSFAVLMETLCQQGEVEVVTTPRAGWHVRSYRLSGVNHGGETSPAGET